jgi:antitoxin VapB
MASLFIRDAETAAVVARLARRTGQTKTALVRQLAAEREAQLDREAGTVDVRRKLADFHRRHPPASPTTAPDHKPALDRMWGEPA